MQSANIAKSIGDRPANQVLVETVRGLDEDGRDRVNGNLPVGLAMDEYRDDFKRGDFLIRVPDAGSAVRLAARVVSIQLPTTGMALARGYCLSGDRAWVMSRGSSGWTATRLAHCWPLAGCPAVDQALAIGWIYARSRPVRASASYALCTCPVPRDRD